MITQYENVIIKTICRLLIPFIQLYAIYVLMHGHYSPGGGFQGGVMMGASFILLVMAARPMSAYSMHESSLDTPQSGQSGMAPSVFCCVRR